MLVGFGQTVCKPIAPSWDTCKINKLCPSAFWDKSKPKNKNKKKKKIEYDSDESEEFEIEEKSDEDTNDIKSKLRKRHVKGSEPPTLDQMEESNIYLKNRKSL